jgi:hypothetical protein
MTVAHPLSIDPTRLAEIQSRSILSGAHDSLEQGACSMELVAYLAGEPHSDHPQCTCPVLGNFVRSWNDSLRSDAQRDRLLKPFLPRLVGTRSTPEVEQRRGMMAFDWLVRVQTPAWLDLTPSLAPHAIALRALPEILTPEDIDAALPTVDAAQKAADAARAAAWAAAGAAAGAAAWDAARDAAWVAAWDAAGAAAGVAAWDAAGAAARDAARDAAWDAVWDAARDAAWVAAWDALASTVVTLQTSASDLLDRMIAVGGAE